MTQTTVNLYDTDNAANILLDFIKDKSQTNKSIDWQRKSKGQFYTHNIITKNLISELVKHIERFEHQQKISIIDPFCGDGRLINAFLLEISNLTLYKNKKWDISFWDIDNHAVITAVQNLKDLAINLELDVEINGIVCDSFSYLEDNINQYDICITNPPWLIVKPSKKEKESLSNEDQTEYIAALKDLDDLLTRYYPLSIPTKKFAGWGTNLARCGTELALTLLNENGICGIVSPASLIGDQVSTNLRKWIFEQFSVKDISYYVAEAKLFGKVDQDVISLTILNDSTKKGYPTLTYFDKNLVSKTHALNTSEWEIIKNEDYIIPIQFGFQILEMNDIFNSFQRFHDLELDGSIWIGREIDETKINSRLLTEGEYPFLKGKMIERYKFDIKLENYLDLTKFKSLPKSIKYERIVWRDVSRMSQKRRMIATIIPDGYVVGNSAHVLYSKENNKDLLKALLAILNSLVFEAQVRASSATNHVSLGIVRNTKIPPLDKVKIKKIVYLLENILENEVQLEVYIASLYGLSYEQFISILTMFHKFNVEEKQMLESEASRHLKRGEIH